MKSVVVYQVMFCFRRRDDVIYLSDVQSVDYDNVSQRVQLRSGGARAYRGRDWDNQRPRVPSTASTASSGYLRPRTGQWYPGTTSEGTQRARVPSTGSTTSTSGYLRPQTDHSAKPDPEGKQYVRRPNEINLGGAGGRFAARGNPDHHRMGENDPLLEKDYPEVFNVKIENAVPTDVGTGKDSEGEGADVGSGVQGRLLRAEGPSSSGSTTSCSPESSPPEPESLTVEAEDDPDSNPEDETRPFLAQGGKESENGPWVLRDVKSLENDLECNAHVELRETEEDTPRSSVSERTSSDLSRSDSERSGSTVSSGRGSSTSSGEAQYTGARNPTFPGLLSQHHSGSGCPDSGLEGQSNEELKCHTGVSSPTDPSPLTPGPVDLYTGKYNPSGYTGCEPRRYKESVTLSDASSGFHSDDTPDDSNSVTPPGGVTPHGTPTQQRELLV